MSDYLSHARHCMDVWADWQSRAGDLGWPSESIEGRAMQMARTATNTRGIAAYHGFVALVDDGRCRRVRKEPPPFPKETPPSATARIPNIDRARLGPQINRHLLDLIEHGGEAQALTLMLHHAQPDATIAERARALGVSCSSYWGRYKQGLAWLAGRLTNGS